MSCMFNFTKFERTNAREVDKITVTASNAIGFPTKFYQDQGLKDYKYVVLYYDSQEMAVGIQFTNNEEEKHKFSILKSKQGYGGSIVATSFFKTSSINPKEYHGRYEWQKENLEGVGELYIIKLKPQTSV